MVDKIKELFSGEIILLVIVFILSFFLSLLGKITQNVFLIISLFLLGYLLVRSLLKTYLDFILKVRDQQFIQDNRSVNFLSFDMLKFVLILAAIVSVLILGLNKVLNNETIATLLGGLVGSLLTMKGSYTDVRIDKETLDQLKGQQHQQ